MKRYRGRFKETDRPSRERAIAGALRAGREAVDAHHGAVDHREDGHPVVLHHDTHHVGAVDDHQHDPHGVDPGHPGAVNPAFSTANMVNATKVLRAHFPTILDVDVQHEEEAQRCQRKEPLTQTRMLPSVTSGKRVNVSTAQIANIAM